MRELEAESLNAGVAAAMRAWPLESHRRMTAEYVLIRGVNDSPEDASRLARLLSGMRVKVNAIPLNEDPVYLPGWKRPAEPAIEAFAADAIMDWWKNTVWRRIRRRCLRCGSAGPGGCHRPCPCPCPPAPADERPGCR